MNTSSATLQSTFVTVLAWLVIIFNGFGSLVALMQNVMINLFMPEMIAKSTQVPAEAFPLTAARMGFFAFLCFAVFMTYVGYALLRRRDWARRTVIVVCALGVAWTLLCLVMFTFGFGFGRLPVSPPGTPPGFDSGFKAMLVMSSIVSLVMCVVLAWIGQRLRSPKVKAEFNQLPALS